MAETQILAETLEQATIFRVYPQGEQSTNHLQNVRYLGSGASSMVFLAELVQEEPNQYQARTRFVTVKMPRYPAEDGPTTLSSTQNSFERELRVRGRLGLLTRNTDPPELWTLDVEDLKFVWSEGRQNPWIGDRPHPMHLLVTPLRTMSKIGTTPANLRAHIPPRGVELARDLRNAFDVARAMANALLAIGSHGVVHGDVKPDNLIVRERNGRIFGILLTDFGSSWRLSEQPMGGYPGTLQYYSPQQIRALRDDPQTDRRSPESDLYAMGLTLIEFMVGTLRLKSTLAKQVELLSEVSRDDRLSLALIRVELLEALAREGTHHQDEAHARFYALVLCYLLENHGGWQPLERLKRFLEDLDVLNNQIETDTLERKQGPGRKRHVHGTGSNPDGAIEAGLTTLMGLWDSEDRLRWCRTYVATRLSDDSPLASTYGAELERAPDHGPELHDLAKELLKSGYGALAARMYRRYLEPASTGAPRDPERELRALITYLGVILPRQEDQEEGERIAARYANRDDRAGAWARMLLAKLRHHTGGPRLRDTPSFVPSPEATRDRRLESWEYHSWILARLDDPRRLGAELEVESRNIERYLTSDVTMWEYATGSLTRARLLTRQRSLQAYRLAIPTVLGAASLAAARRLPHEYVATLIVVCSLIVRGFETEASAATLRAMGADPIKVLHSTCACALAAAELYALLGSPRRRDRALHLAARCLVAIGSPEALVQAMRWRSLARNLSMLRGEDVWPRSSVEELIPVYQELTKAHPGRHLGGDPGEAVAANFRAMLGSFVDHIWKPRATFALESRPSEAGTTALDALLAVADPAGSDRSLRVLVLGCADGAEALELARRGHEVQVVDPSRARVQSLESRTEDGMQLRAYAMPLASPRLSLTVGGYFDRILLRDHLFHVSGKRKLLRWIADALLPDGRLMLSDWVQVAEGPADLWWGLERTLPFTDWESPAGLTGMLREAGMKVLWHQDWTSSLREGMANMIATGRAYTSGLEATLSTRQRIVHRRFNDTVDWLTRASAPGGPLGWWAFVAAPQGPPARR